MFLNYIKVALRHLQRHRIHSLVNVLGLATGMAACLLILLFVQSELAFDNMHSRADRLYRVNKTVLDEGGLSHTAEMPGNFAPAMARDFPEVEAAARLRPWWSEMLVTREDRAFNVEHVVFADSTFFRLFDFKLLQGDPQTALAQPLSIVITPEIATRFFGEQDPMGQVLNGLFDMPMQVTGIIEPAPDNSHLQYDILLSWSTSDASPYAGRFDWMNRWITQAIFTYVLLHENASPETVDAKFPAFMQRYMTRWAEKYSPYLQPFGDIHLHSAHVQNQFNHRAGNATYVGLFIVVALLVLGIACINFMNLATARASTRAREVGMRKVLGAWRRDLIRQFLGEAIVMSFLALVLAILLCEAALPLFNSLTDRHLELAFFDSLTLPLALLSLAGLVGVVAGSYPAFVLARFRPAGILKTRTGPATGGANLRKSLVVLQYFFSIALIFGTLVVTRQMQFVQATPLGFAREHTLLIPLPPTAIRGQTNIIKERLQVRPEIIAVSAGSGGPALGTMGFDVLPEGRPDSDRKAIPTIGVDFDFRRTFDIKLASGRDFSKSMPTDSASVLLNETAVRQFGWTNETALGKQVTIGTSQPTPYTVIGVVRDFHVRSLHLKIDPLVIYPTQSRFYNLVVRTSGRDLAGTIAFLGTVWQEFERKHPFAYRFLEEDLAEMYESERRLMLTLSGFAGLAIFIACMGLFGLAAFYAERRRREIGIRKILGAAPAGLVFMLARNFLLLVAIACVLAWPAGYLFAQNWLQEFAYRTTIAWDVFAVSAGAALIVSLVAVAFQAIRASMLNPVDVLRQE